MSDSKNVKRLHSDESFPCTDTVTHSNKTKISKKKVDLFCS